jgi:hypothetical protein
MDVHGIHPIVVTPFLLAGTIDTDSIATLTAFMLVLDGGKPGVARAVTRVTRPTSKRRCAC